MPSMPGGRGTEFSAVPLFVLAGSFLLSLLLARCLPLPQPQFHDEFSYLLAGDTFAHGRLTNPPHPMWRFFETYQELQQPTYMSKYPPAQGMLLAIGIRIADLPIVGVWIGTALACLIGWWALLGMGPRKWANVGAVLVIFHPLITLKWNWSYWGGEAAMIGGGLVIGAAARFSRRTNLHWTTGVAMGIGIGILLHSRPFEGMVLTTTIFCGLFIRHSRRINWRPIVACAATLLPLIGWTTYYNYRITGRATTFPYAMYEQHYAPTAPLIWLPPPSSQPTYQQAVMREFYLGWEWPLYQQQREFGGLARAMIEKAKECGKTFLASPVLAIPFFAAILFARRDRKLRGTFLIGTIVLAASFSGLSFFSHYFAPATVLLFFILLRGLRYIRATLPRGRQIAACIIAIHILMFAAVVFARMRQPSEQNFANQRAQFVTAIRSEYSKSLVFVRYPEHYYVHNEWVFNEADIDRSTVVFARDRGDAANVELIRYFNDRMVLMLDLGTGQLIAPYRVP